MIDRPPPPLGLIRAFECTARHLSFTLAARELGYTQAAVSAQVRALEKYVARPLFVRKTRSLKLTDIGEAFLPTLLQGLQQIDDATNAILTGSRENTVSVACPMSLAENWLPGVLVGFREHYPDIDVIVHGTVWEAPGEPAADLTITINRRDEAPDTAKCLWPEKLVLLCAPSTAQGLTSATAIPSAPKIFVMGRQEYWTGMAAALSLPGVDLDRGYRTNSTNIALEMAASGLGITVALETVSRTYLERGLLVDPLGVRPISPWSYYLASGSTRNRTVAEQLRAWIASAKPYMQDRGLPES